MGAKHSRHVQPCPIDAYDETYSAAGVIFTDGTYCLAGYQPGKKNPCITGIGGMKEVGETAILTALREAVEEIFNIKSVPPAFIKALQDKLRVRNCIKNNTYIIFVYTFNDLELVLKLAKQYKIHSTLYTRLPRTLMELIFLRDVSQPSEIRHISLLPLVYHNPQVGPLVSRDFVVDMNMLTLRK